MPDPQSQRHWTRDEVIQALKEGQSLEGQNLQGLDLSNADLGEAWFIKANLQEINFERANLEHAHLFGANLQGANLFNANLKYANLKNTKLIGANLLEAKLEGAKISGITWGPGNRLINEVEGRALDRKGRFQEAKEKYREAEEVYRNIRNTLVATGCVHESGDFFYREMVVRRKQMPRFSLGRLISGLVDWLCGYGEKAIRVLIAAASLILICSFFYFFTGIHHDGSLLVFDVGKSWLENLETYLLTVYYSVVTFTTLGYGDIAPVGLSRAVASLEAFFGSFMIALFVVVFVRKTLR